jgi:hypothetical protein
MLTSMGNGPTTGQKPSCSSERLANGRWPGTTMPWPPSTVTPLGSLGFRSNPIRPNRTELDREKHVG